MSAIFWPWALFFGPTPTAVRFTQSRILAYYLFREWAERPVERPWARSGAASMARFARTSRRSSTYRGTFTTKPSPLVSEKFRRATAGSSLEIRVSADFASKRWSVLCADIRLSFRGSAADGHLRSVSARAASQPLSSSIFPLDVLLNVSSHFMQPQAPRTADRMR